MFFLDPVMRVDWIARGKKENDKSWQQFDVNTFLVLTLSGVRAGGGAGVNLVKCWRRNLAWGWIGRTRICNIYNFTVTATSIVTFMDLHTWHRFQRGDFIKNYWQGIYILIWQTIDTNYVHNFQNSKLLVLR